MPTALTHGDAQDLLATFKRGWESRQPDVIVELFGEDADYRSGPFSDPVEGRLAIRRHWNEIAATTVHVEFDAERIWVSGRTVLSSYHAAYTRRSSAERIRVRGFMTFELADDGTVARFRQWPTTRVVGLDETVRPEGKPAGQSAQMEEAADGR